MDSNKHESRRMKPNDNVEWAIQEIKKETGDKPTVLKVTNRLLLEGIIFSSTSIVREYLDARELGQVDGVERTLD